MSQYDIQRACGHQDTIDIRGTNVRGERDRRAMWEGALDCFACRRAERQVRNDELNARAARIAEASGWPALSGSDRQAAWAQDIRATMIAALVDECGTREDIAALLITAILRRTDARWWIDRRGLTRSVRTAMDLVDEPGIARTTYGTIRDQAQATMTDAEREQLAALESAPDTSEPDSPDTPQASIGALRAGGWSVAKIAAQVGVHTSTVYRWAAGTRTPNPVNRAALALITRS